MVEFINKITGGRMLVADDQADRYRAAGHKPAAVPEKKASVKKPSGRKKG